MTSPADPFPPHDPAGGPSDSVIVQYYTHEYDEETRLARSPAGRLEHVRTQEIVRRALPSSPVRIADVGGGTGTHAKWLVADGHDVVLVDLTPSHVDAARRAFPALSALVGDARALPLDDDSVDAVLLLGPLYHLTAVDDRLQALREAVRVCRPGGQVIAAAISRYAALLDLAAQGRLTSDVLAKVRGQMATGVHDHSVGFTEAYFHLPDELAGELRGAGLTDVTLHGVEGPLWIAFHGAEADADIEHALAVARELETDPAAMGMGSHLLAVGTVAG